MAHQAISGAGEIFAALHHAGGLQLCRNTGGISLVIIGERYLPAPGKVHGPGSRHDIAGNYHADADDHGQAPQ
jgi:hypothetical protein